MLEAVGPARRVAVGNTEVPLVAAIDDPTVEVFVVEASSFRLRFAERFRPTVATWLNLAPDHLDWHATLAAYEAAKARIWGDQAADDGRRRQRRRPGGAAPTSDVRRGGVSPSARLGGDYHVDGGAARDPGATARSSRVERARTGRCPTTSPTRWPPPATALEGGAPPRRRPRACSRTFRGLPHRVALVGEAGGVRWYDDSKATAPHATLRRGARASTRSC